MSWTKKISIIEDADDETTEEALKDFLVRGEHPSHDFVAAVLV